ncbi:DUF4290 domain-containing protein [Algoriphagus boritolerans]|uniref:DUF4290 domain-containing protein n=1 Tax=Algoriphagus boritolerans TaxID=308111 RepID=UPI000AAC5551
MKEYGKNIQRLVDHVTAIEDRDKRTQSAYTVVEIIKQLNPTWKQENDQKLWDDIYIMSNFKLDVDAPFPIPEKELLGKKNLSQSDIRRVKSSSNTTEETLRSSLNKPSK